MPRNFNTGVREDRRLCACGPARRSEGGAAAKAPASSEAVAVVRYILTLLDGQLKYDHAKLAFDRIVDPSLNSDATLAELDLMTKAARRLAGPSPDDAAKLNALRKLVYEGGPWNDHRPFS